jgi:hypothetical protein
MAYLPLGVSLAASVFSSFAEAVSEVLLLQEKSKVIDTSTAMEISLFVFIFTLFDL